MSDPVLDPVLAAINAVEPDASIIAEFQNSEWDDIASSAKIVDAFLYFTDAQRLKTWSAVIGIVKPEGLISYDEGVRRIKLLCAKPFNITAYVLASIKALKCTEGADITMV